MKRSAAAIWWSAAAVGLCLAVALFAVACGSGKSSKVTGLQSGQDPATNVSGNNGQGATTVVNQTGTQTGTATGSASHITCTGAPASANTGSGTANAGSSVACGNVTVQLTLDLTVNSSINTSIGSSISVSN